MSAGERAARTTFETLREIDPSLANLQLEHRAGARALSRVVTGNDAALSWSWRLHQRLVSDMIAAMRSTWSRSFSEDIVLGAARRQLPYCCGRYARKPGMVYLRAPYHTTCTSLGAVVNAQADPVLSEKVAQASPQIHRQRAGAVYAAAGDLFVVRLPRSRGSYPASAR